MVGLHFSWSCNRVDRCYFKRYIHYFANFNHLLSVVKSIIALGVFLPAQSTFLPSHDFTYFGSAMIN